MQLGVSLVERNVSGQWCSWWRPAIGILGEVAIPKDRRWTDWHCRVPGGLQRSCSHDRWVEITRKATGITSKSFWSCHFLIGKLLNNYCNYFTTCREVWKAICTCQVWYARKYKCKLFLSTNVFVNKLKILCWCTPTLNPFIHLNFRN